MIRRADLVLSLQFADARLRPLVPRHQVQRWLCAALESPAEITVRFVGDDEGRALNRDFRQKDYATNVLTFDYQHEPLVVADLVLAAGAMWCAACARFRTSSAGASCWRTSPATSPFAVRR